MHHRWFTRTYLNRIHPRVLLERVRYNKRFDLTGAFGWNVVRFRNRNDDVRFYAPPIRPVRRRSLVPHIPFWRSIIGPGCQSLDVGLGQSGRIPKVTVLGISKPRRHLFAQDRRLDRFRPRTRAFVGEERHGSNFTRPVTDLTVLLKYWKHILIKGDQIRLGRNGRRNLRGQRCYAHQNDNRKESGHKGLLGWVWFFGT